MLLNSRNHTISTIKYYIPYLMILYDTVERSTINVQYNYKFILLCMTHDHEHAYIVAMYVRTV